MRQVVTEVQEHDSITRSITARYESNDNGESLGDPSSSSQRPVTTDSWSSNLDAATAVSPLHHPIPSLFMELTLT